MKKKDLVVEYIKNMINKGRLRQGDKIPTESEIMKELNISRFTARSGIDSLRKENIIETLHGSGSYVKNFSGLKKYILIIAEDNVISGVARESYRFIINELKNKIEELNYIPYYYIDRKKSDVLKEIPQIIAETKGVLSVQSTDKTLDTLSNFNIPIVSVIKCTAKDYSTVMTDYPSFYAKIYNLTKKYNLKRILIFQISHTIYRNNKDNYIHYANDAYCKRYDFVYVNYSNNLPSAISIFTNKMKSLKYIPDVIIFLDETIYNNVFPIFPEFDKILRKTKIITHSSGYRQDWGDTYDICRVEFNMKEMAEKAIELLIKKIHGEFINRQNIYLEPVVINEEIFK
ncbi:MAG: GntR family transcriptional regulator [Abditibacteriota bacterium]|nr:GntR family transcriptional regulator [Abditibacteriota bacterium]